MHISNCVKIRFPGVISRNWLVCPVGWSVQIVPFLCELFLFEISISFSVEAGLRIYSSLVHDFPLFPVFWCIASRICRTHYQRFGNSPSFGRPKNSHVIAVSFQLIETPRHT